MNNIKRLYVYSTIMYYFEYDKVLQRLTIGFNDGKVCQYNSFPNAMFLQFCEAKSYGHFYLDHIKRKYKREVLYGSERDLNYSIYNRFRYGAYKLFRLKKKLQKVKYALIKRRRYKLKHNKDKGYNLDDYTKTVSME